MATINLLNNQIGYIIKHLRNLSKKTSMIKQTESASKDFHLCNKPRFHIQVEIKLGCKQRTPFRNVSIHSNGGGGGGGAVKLSLCV